MTNYIKPYLSLKQNVSYQENNLASLWQIISNLTLVWNLKSSYVIRLYELWQIISNLTLVWNNLTFRLKFAIMLLWQIISNLTLVWNIFDATSHKNYDAWQIISNLTLVWNSWETHFFRYLFRWQIISNLTLVWNTLRICYLYQFVTMTNYIKPYLSLKLINWSTFTLSLKMTNYIKPYLSLKLKE